MQIPDDAAIGLDLLEDRKRLLLDTLVDELTPFIDLYRHSSSVDQSTLRSGFSKDSFSTLNSYACNIAAIAVRKSSVEDVRRGLAASAIEGGAWDYRETTMNLCLLYNAGSKLGMNLDDLFVEAATLGSRSSADLIIGYLRNGDKRLESMGYKEGVNRNGESDFVSTS